MATICTAVMLAAATAGLPANTCTLQCDYTGGLVAYADETKTTGTTAPYPEATLSEWISVHRVDGRWLEILEQEPRMCMLGDPERVTVVVKANDPH